MDPHPRSYPTLVTLIRRTGAGPAVAPATTTCDEIRSWLLSGALDEKGPLGLVEALVWRMVAAGLPVDRVTIHTGTLHPQLLGFYWHWNRADGLVDELKVDLAGLDTDRYRRSPLARVLEHGEEFRAKFFDRKMAEQYPLLQDLMDEGMRDYCVLPLVAGSTYHNAITLATRSDTGFSDHDMLECRRILEIFALHVEKQTAWRITENVLDTYLGTVARKQVLKGAIQRGSGESLRAVIWMSDLRGFTALANRLPETDVLAILNAYFECIAGAVLFHGGEILKFMGDGLLAVFPVQGETGNRRAAASLAAAETALQDIEALNTQPPRSLSAIDGWQPLKTGIALHLGEVFFGNVGAPERLDFTVIGLAVNQTSRVEMLTKELACPLLVTEPVARLLDRKLEDKGRHRLRGLPGAVRLYSVLPIGK